MEAPEGTGSSLFTRLKRELKNELRMELLQELKHEAQNHLSSLHKRVDVLDSKLQLANDGVARSKDATDKVFGLLRLYDDEHSALVQTLKEMQVRFKETEAAIFTLLDKLTGVVDNNQKSIERQEQNQLEVAADVKYISDRFKLLYNKTMGINKTFGSAMPRGSVVVNGETSLALLDSGLGNMGDFLESSNSSARTGVERKSNGRPKLSSFDDTLEEGSDEDGEANGRISSSAMQALEERMEKLHAMSGERLTALAVAMDELRSSVAALGRGLAKASERGDVFGTPDGLQRLKKVLARVDISQNADVMEVRGDIALLKRRLMAVVQTVKHYSAPNAAHGTALPTQSHKLEVKTKENEVEGGGREALKGRALALEREVAATLLATAEPQSTDNVMAEGPQPPVKGNSHPLSSRVKKIASYVPAPPQRKGDSTPAGSKDFVIISRRKGTNLSSPDTYGKSLFGSEDSAGSLDSRKYRRIVQDVERLKSYYSCRAAETRAEDPEAGSADPLMADFADGRVNLLDDREDCPDSVSEITFRP